MVTLGSLFTGIGGLDLGLERAGMRVVWQVEIDEYCRRVLAKHWPKVRRYNDVRTLRFSDMEAPDVICGGFPCQPVSYAGARKGQADPRWLWPAFARVVDVLRPRFVVVENVPGLLSLGGSEVLADLAAMGYDAEWGVLSAASVGAPHLRNRFWLVGYPHDSRKPVVPVDDETSKLPEPVAYAAGSGRETIRGGKEAGSGEGRTPGGSSDSGECGRGWWDVEPDVGRVAYGVSGRMDRLRSLGNAVVPRWAEEIGRRVVQWAK